MDIRLKRAYEPADGTDGFRVLVERLWPRGVAKADADIDLWAKDVAPSTELRKWFAHDPTRWDEFRSRYFAELLRKEAAWRPLLERARKSRVTFVFAAKEEHTNNAVALAEFLESQP